MKSQALAIRLFAAAAGAIAVLGIAGWVFHIVALEQLLPGLATMKFNTALMILLIALSWLVRRPIGPTLAAIAAAIAAVQIAEYLFRVNLGVDQLVFADHGSDSYPGRTSLAAAICLLVLAMARELHESRRRSGAQVGAGFVLGIAVLSILGYGYGVASLYAIGPFSSIALILLSLASLVASAGRMLAWVVGGEDSGAVLIRRIGPFAAIGLPVLGFLVRVGQRAGWVEQGSALALLVVLCGVGVGVLTLTAGLRMRTVDESRAAALADLTALKNSLERQSLDRAHLLQERQAELAVMQDRQRIAADLHDVVIQRLFAAGMVLQGVSPSQRDEQTRRQLNIVIDTMDGAIKDLRTSIFGLNSSRGTVASLADALGEICDESARILGFLPDLTVDDPDFEADLFREDLLAVAREALANVAKHACASRAEVVLRPTDGLVRLCVVDDGVGIAGTPDLSGTRNIAQRAQRRGGGCTWSSPASGGTRVEWQVPGLSVQTAMDTRDRGFEARNAGS